MRVTTKDALACFGWSARAWARPWRAFVRAHPGLRVGDALEVGAGPRSSLVPLLLPLADRVECSASLAIPTFGSSPATTR